MPNSTPGSFDWPSDRHAQQGHAQGHWSTALGAVRGAEPGQMVQDSEPPVPSSFHEEQQHRHQQQQQQEGYSAYNPEAPLTPLARRLPPHLDPLGGGSYSAASASGHGGPYQAPPAPLNSAYESYPLAQGAYPPPQPVLRTPSALACPPSGPAAANAAPAPTFAEQHHLSMRYPAYPPASLAVDSLWTDPVAQSQAPQPMVAGSAQLYSAGDDCTEPTHHGARMAQPYDGAATDQWHSSAPPPPPPLVPFGAPEPWVQQAHSPYLVHEPLHLDVQPQRYATLPHVASSLFAPHLHPSPYDTFSTSPAFDASATSQWVRTQALEPTPSSVPAWATTDQPHYSRFSTYPPSTYPPSTYPPSTSHPHSYASYPPPALSHQPFDGSSDALAGPSAPGKRSRPMVGGALAAASPPAPRRSYKTSQNPDKKLTVDLHTTCIVCAEPLAKLILRGKRAELDVPHAAVMTCLACSSSSTPHSEEPKDGKAKKATFRKRNKRFDDASAIIACDVCLRDIAIGGVLPLPLDAPDPTTRIDFMIEIVCAACDVKYKRCSDCGGGGGSRTGTGKWRCAELFPPQRKTCSLKHQRLGAFPAMEYSVYRNTDIPHDELDELSDTLRSMFVNGMLAGLCIPEVLEQDGSVYSTYEQCQERARQGWCGFDPLIRYNVEAQTGIRRYLALRTCTPNLRKPSRQTPGDSPAGSPEPALGPDEPRPEHKHGGVVLKEGKEIAGFIIAEQELFVGNLFFCIVLPWDPTGEIFDATSLLISALIRHVDADVKSTSAERVQQGLPPLPDIAKVWTMLFFKRDSRVLTSLVKKRGFAYLEDYLAAHPEVSAEEFPPYRKCYLPVERQEQGWEILVRQQRVMADGSVDDWGARRGADEERGKKKELRARAAAGKGPR